MPFQIKEEDGKFIVYNLDTNKKQGEYDTRRLAMGRMKDLYAEEKKGTGKPAKPEKEDDDDGEDEE